MRTGTGNRSNYNRTTGSRTARLYSKKTAKNINRIYQSNEEVQRREREKALEDAYGYDDYYDDPKVSRGSSSGRIGLTVLAASLIVVILALVFVGLKLLQSDAVKSTKVNLEPETTAEQAEGTVTVPTRVYEESDPPVIYGVIPIVVYAGHSVSYKQGVYVEDDTDDSPTLEIDNESVDLSTPGTYIVSYIARDKDANVTREATSVTVLEGENLVSDEEIFRLADSVLGTILRDDMTEPEKCLRIYEYLHAIGYVDKVHSEDWMQNAYWMLTLREGDCFCYYSAARLLLSRLGYEVMEVRNNNNYIHYWCLVSIDGGNTWWHFDACDWSWGEDGVLCLVSDNYLSEFTRRHRTSDGRLIHAWDKTNYPATPAEDFWTDADRSVIYEDGLLVLYTEDLDYVDFQGYGDFDPEAEGDDAYYFVDFGDSYQDEE